MIGVWKVPLFFGETVWKVGSKVQRSCVQILHANYDVPKSSFCMQNRSARAIALSPNGL